MDITNGKSRKSNSESAAGDVSAPHPGHVNLSFDSEHRLRAENLSWDIDVWYPMVASITYKSHFIPLTMGEAKAIRSFHDVSWRHSKPELTLEEISNLISLEKSIDDCLTANFGKKGAFLRLCGRSPKDGEPLDKGSVWCRYQENLATLCPDGRIPDLCDRMLAIARTPLLRVNSGAEALSLLLSSERVYADMLDWTRFGEPEQLCLREWSESLSMDYEFRVFVYGNTITGVSQYDHYSFFPHLLNQKPIILERIRAFWETEVHPRLRGMANYVVDVGYIPDSGEVVLIELSPFFPCTGSALFRWEDERDSDILHGRHTAGVDAPAKRAVPEPDFRVKASLAEVHPQMSDLIDVNWEHRWITVEGGPPYWEHYGEHRHASPGAVAAEATGGGWWWWWWLGQVAGNLQIGQHLALLPSPPGAPSAPAETVTLFVYGTLRRGFYWCGKYLAPRLGARFLGSATTNPTANEHKYSIVVGDSGVPYLLSEGQGVVGLGVVRGECWEVTLECLRGLDDYEGCSKGYYRRVPIAVQLTPEGDQNEVSIPNKTPTQIEAHVYVPVSVPDDLKEKPRLEEYTMDIHKEKYHAIKHIQVKQLGYIKQPSMWGRGGASAVGNTAVDAHVTAVDTVNISNPSH